MPLRAQIERWSRNELEEHFHKVSDEVRTLKQNNQKMQKEIKIINGRINAGVGIESRAQIKQNNNEYEGLERSNKVLSQKVRKNLENSKYEEWKTEQPIVQRRNEFKNIQMDIQNFDVSDEWDKNNRLREITKQNRAIVSENEDLRFSLEKSEKKLSTISKEYDKLAVELTNARNGYQSQTESLSSFREEIQRKAENSSKNAQISDRELNILREEYRTIKSAYDKIIARWQKMYEDVYEELEKVRQILLAEHELNNRLREEV
uniref:Uncharacterized protein n=1 Tax=Meloidogyne javanica TaxID=6303 RepID=A0A915N147_MELJA